MVKTFTTIEREGEFEFYERKSRFIGMSFFIEDAEQATAILASLKKKYHDATHVCSAFIADKEGNLCRFSDDGEPQGTAGMPILQVLENRGLRQTLVAVIRYFGGIKLGAGGLVRAYHRATVGVIDASGVLQKTLKNIYQIHLPYNQFDIFCSICAKSSVSIIDKAFSERCMAVFVCDEDMVSRLTEGFNTDVQLIGQNYF